MVTLYWAGFPALVNWLARGERRPDNAIPPPAPESTEQREKRWAEEAAGIRLAPVRWGNFR